MSQARTWRCAQGKGPAITRAHIARWIAKRAGQGTVWIDRGGHGRLLSQPLQEWQGDALEDLGALPLPAQVQGQEQWAGWCSYDCAAKSCAPLSGRSTSITQVALRVYSGALHLHTDARYRCVGRSDTYASLFELAQREPNLELPRWGYGKLQHQWPYERYVEAFARIGEYLRCGDSYQINLSHPFEALDNADPRDPLRRAVESFANLAERAPAPHGAFIDVDGTRAILSNSPELLFSLEPQGADWRLCTGPIKGTRPRSPDPVQDRHLAQELLASEKDAAEHLMIVDLLRNDLVRVARSTTVRAPAKPSLLSLPTVHHLESQIDAQLDPRCNSVDLWRALAPGGSVTGAPKRRSIEIIDELEGAARGIYCGSIFVGDARSFCASIAIRTAEARDGALFLRSGGGIVLDSKVQEEWQETLDKARAFLPPKQG